jgi:hypothetical protein
MILTISTQALDVIKKVLRVLLIFSVAIILLTTVGFVMFS